MSLTFDIKDNSTEILNALQKQVETALEAVGLQAEGDAKLELENSPRRIDTGLLRNSITHALGGKSAAITSYHGDRTSKYSKKQAIPFRSYTGTAPQEPTPAVWIGTNVEYAENVHEGTDRMEPNRFLKNAITKNQSTYNKILEKYLKQ